MEVSVGAFQAQSQKQIDAYATPYVATEPRVVTCLITLLRTCSQGDRQRLADLAGTSVNYLYGLGSCARGGMSSRLAFGIEDASIQLHKETHGRTPIVSARELSTMCSLVGMRKH
ncbi:hypothetical protein [Glaciimonas soli]|uniref:Uncharacterized protein n=1 Tax=Glaciimonas soli TaxID=2590999 RepID=A0A843YWJ3_9BURK|nr:hypothetical protein [Glaciimonas soli]MQR02347.1 hypothetical protein [Glaciimonas soli]